MKPAPYSPRSDGKADLKLRCLSKILHLNSALLGCLHPQNSMSYYVLPIQMKSWVWNTLHWKCTKKGELKDTIEQRAVAFWPVAFLMTTARFSSALGSGATNNLDPDFKSLISINFERSDWDEHYGNLTPTIRWPAEPVFMKRLFGSGKETDALERDSLPDRRYWLRFPVWSRHPHSTDVHQLSVPNANVIHNYRDTLSEPRNTDVFNFSGHGMTQQRRHIPEI